MSTSEKSSASLSRWVIYSLVFLVLLILQNTISLHISNVWLIIPAVVALSFSDESDTGLILGGIFGMLWDITSGKILGYNALFLIITAVACQLILKNMVRVRWTTNLLVTLAAVMIYQLLTYLIFFVFWGNPGNWYTFLLALLYAFISSIIAALLLFPLFGFLRRKSDAN